MGAIYLSAGAKKAVSAADPTPEEMLAIGIAIGLQQNTQSVSRAPKMTPWKMAARLRM